jgi:hypothetical protein
MNSLTVYRIHNHSNLAFAKYKKALSVNIANAGNGLCNIIFCLYYQ